MNLNIDLKNDLTYICTGNKNSNDTLLFIHGAGGNSESLYDLALNFKDYNCILVDLPGHGQSTKDIPDSITGYCDVIEKFIASESSWLGENITCIGHSMGGMISMALALRKIPAIKQIVILNSAAKFDLDKKFMHKIYKGIVDKVYLFRASGSFFHPRTYNFFFRNLNKLPEKNMVKDFILVEHFDLRDQVENISIPALIVTGEKEILALPEDSRFLNSNIKNSELEIMPDLAHLLPIIAHEKLFQRIQKFIKAH